MLIWIKHWFTYFLVFFHLVLEFSASQAGTLMLIGQVVDALATPFVGYHSDQMNSDLTIKYGKRKLWHLFGTACVLGSFPFIFTQCIGCSMSHKWAQMFYYASFIMIFQIGWAAVQISHLSLIPELSNDDHTRTHLTAVRFGFTVFSNLFVYLVTWLVLHITGECDKQVGPGDAWKFRHIVYIVMSVGTAASIMFHILVHERHNHDREINLIQDASTHSELIKRPALYQVPVPKVQKGTFIMIRLRLFVLLHIVILPKILVAGVYMSSRLVVNISQVLIPLYLHRSLGLPSRSLAVVPLVMYLGSLTAAASQRVAPRSLSRKLNYLIGAICAISAFLWIFYGRGYVYQTYLIYIVAVLIGFGGAIMLITSLALTADLVGSQTRASAFVYGLMSFTDKLSCGIAIALIQKYADGAETSYYREILSWVCGSATVLGLVLTMLISKINTGPTVECIVSGPAINSLEDEVNQED